jgi:hypothetical protein
MEAAALVLPPSSHAQPTPDGTMTFSTGLVAFLQKLVRVPCCYQEDVLSLVLHLGLLVHPWPFGFAYIRLPWPLLLTLL